MQGTESIQYRICVARALKRKLDTPLQGIRKSALSRYEQHDFEEEQRQMEDADPTLWSKSRMERIAFNADGTPAGPFLCTLDDGQQFYVISIQSIMDQVVILQLADENGAAGPVLRFPYARITGMEIVEA